MQHATNTVQATKQPAVLAVLSVHPVLPGPEELRRVDGKPLLNSWQGSFAPASPTAYGQLQLWAQGQVTAYSNRGFFVCDSLSNKALTNASHAQAAIKKVANTLVDATALIRSMQRVPMRGTA